MACFGGYHMPLWYPAGAKAEHLAVLTAAGLFDTSHMALLSLHGPGARTLLQRCCCRDLERCLGKARGPLVPGRSVYTMFLDERGFVIDDAIVSQCADADYTVVVNASMGAAVAAHLAAHNREGARIVDARDGPVICRQRSRGHIHQGARFRAHWDASDANSWRRRRTV